MLESYLHHIQLIGSTHVNTRLMVYSGTISLKNFGVKLRHPRVFEWTNTKMPLNQSHSNSKSFWKEYPQNPHTAWSFVSYFFWRGEKGYTHNSIYKLAVFDGISSPPSIHSSIHHPQNLWSAQQHGALPPNVRHPRHPKTGLLRILCFRLTQEVKNTLCTYKPLAYVFSQDLLSTSEMDAYPIVGLAPSGCLAVLAYSTRTAKKRDEWMPTMMLWKKMMHVWNSCFFWVSHPLCKKSGAHTPV